MRASSKQIGSFVGKMIFPGRVGVQRIQNHLEKSGGEKLQRALVKHGMGSTDTRKIAKALSGQSHGWSQAKYKSVVAALQDAKLVKRAKSASSMVLRASREAQGTIGSGLTPEQIKMRMKVFAHERRLQANVEEDADKGDSESVLGRMRGAVGEANKADESVRGLREELQRDMRLQPKIPLQRPKKAGDVGTGFQS